jgi:GT2 family glycosyltransferase
MWLEELVETFDNLPNTGLVGSKLIYPDGRLQEAGGIIWKDGSAWNFGNKKDINLPEFNYAREVDYCSGASIILPQDLFQELGGFDEHYLPLYCED